jgi:hypothetical protein
LGFGILNNNNFLEMRTLLSPGLAELVAQQLKLWREWACEDLVWLIQM